MSASLMTMLLLSCDNYSDLWDDFFNLKERFWPDCPFKWYIVTETADYNRNNVQVIQCGKELNWAGRLRYAVKNVDTPYIGLYLDDYFIVSKIDNKRIESYLELMYKDHVSFLNLGNVFHHITNLHNKDYYKDHLINIPKHLRYGIDTSAAIWEKEYLLKKIGKGDYSAWKFEIDRCLEAESEKGLDGLILCDELLSFNVCEIPVVIQGKLYPDAVKYFAESIKYQIQSKRQQMRYKDVLRYKLKVRMSNVKICRKLLKWIGEHLLGYNFFTQG